MTAGMLAMILAVGITACTKADNTTKTENTSTSESDGKKNRRNRITKKCNDYRTEKDLRKDQADL